MPRRTSPALVVTVVVLVAAALALWYAGPAALQWIGEMHGGRPPGH